MGWTWTGRRMAKAIRMIVRSRKLRSEVKEIAAMERQAARVSRERRPRCQSVDFQGAGWRSVPSFKEGNQTGETRRLTKNPGGEALAV